MTKCIYCGFCQGVRVRGGGQRWGSGRSGVRGGMVRGRVSDRGIRAEG